VRVVERSGIVLLAASGQQDKEIAAVMAHYAEKSFSMTQTFPGAGSHFSVTRARWTHPTLGNC
jgi:hypothetical protein